MAKKRAKFLETRVFGFVIAAGIVGLTLLAGAFTALLDRMELLVYDTHFLIKDVAVSRSVQEGSVLAERGTKLSEDILIVGIDLDSLATYGKWPFPRATHAGLVNAFSRIKDQTKRESALLLDVFFIDPDPDEESDKTLSSAIAESGRVFLETALSVSLSSAEQAVVMDERSKLMYETKGTLTKVRGDWKSLPYFLASEPPLPAYIEGMKGYGHANFISDDDEKFRRQPLVAKASLLLEEIELGALKPGFTVQESSYERLAWIDSFGAWRNVDLPLTERSLADLAARMKEEAPPRIVDENGDGQPDREIYVLRRFQDYFVPSITLALAANYFGKELSELDVEIGRRIRIDSPTRYDPETGERRPYEIVVKPDVYDEAGALVKAGQRRLVPYIEIPIDARGAMLVNFMGRPSSENADGQQTFPVRSYAGYAARDPGPDQAAWRRTLAAGNKIVMVGAFAKGVASDEKTTPFGLMYGIEIHANALNTILMDNFIRRAPYWLDLVILLSLVGLVAFAASRLSTILSLFGTLVLVFGYFIATTMVFDRVSFLLSFSPSAVAMLFTFVSIVVYRAMTEEKDKKRIRETFGKYVSPRVVDQLVENPPELGGVDKQLTVLFSDIRGFTTLSESMSPQELVNHLNIYLTAMTDCILDYGGTLDKYVGDEIMCFWGAPLPQEDHAVLACKCAIMQMKKLRELNEGWPEALRINIGIGLNSGTMTVGNMGSPLRMNYTLMGDNVNLGARLEGTNKEYGTGIIISEATYALVADKFVVRELDNIRVKGKNKPVLIYELVDCLESLDPPAPPAAKGQGAAKAAISVKPAKPVVDGA